MEQYGRVPDATATIYYIISQVCYVIGRWSDKLVTESCQKIV